MHRHAVLLAALTGLVTFAGCLDDAPAKVPVSTGTPEPGTLTLTGLVQSAAFEPLGGANITLFETQQTVTTAADGSFRFTDLPGGVYTLTATAAGFEDATTTVSRPGGGNESVVLILQPVATDVPYSITLPTFNGFIECGLEVLIITPSCDTTLRVVGGSLCGTPANVCQDLGVFQDDSVFYFETEAAWKTVVVDVVFDPAANPGMDGMRVSLYGADADAEVFDYERYHQAHGPEPFSLRADAGADYGDDGGAVPVNATAFRLELFPHGHKPDGFPIFLGAGIAQRLEFDVFVTLFYHEAAPDGFTLRA